MLSIKKTGGGTEYPIHLLEPDVLRAAQEWYDNGRFDELLNPAGAVWGQDPHQQTANYRIGSLYWPVVGASRFACAVVALGSYELGKLRADLGSTAAVTLTYTDDPDDGGEPGREFPLYLLASRPLSRTTSAAFPSDEPDEDDLYLLTLVDKRYYWCHTPGTGLGSAPASWAALFTALGTRVGTTLTVDAVDADYLTPTAEWVSAAAKRTSAAVLLDRAAACVGSRIVVVPGGDFVQRPSGANRTAATDFHDAYSIPGDADERFGGGGPIDSDEQLRGIPGTVLAVWPDDTEETAATATGVAAGKVLVTHDIPATASAGQRTALLAQWRDDYYAWADAPLDAVYDGFLVPPTSGFVGAAELYHDAACGYTRISRPPIGSAYLLPAESGTAADDGSCGGTCGTLIGLADDACLSVELVCATGTFADILPDQVSSVGGQFRSTGTGTWTLQYWHSGAWADLAFDWTGGSGTLVLTFGTDGKPILTLDGKQLYLKCAGADATFVGGKRNGFTGGAAAPAGACASNDFVLRVACQCCSIDGWAGPGWYCVREAGTEDACVPTELLEADRCDDTIEICSGPYADEATADEACAPDPGITVCGCENPMPTKVCATISLQTGSHSCLAGPYTLTAAGGGWHVLSLPYPCPTVSGTGQLALTCPGGSIPFVVGFTASGFDITVTPVTVSTSGCGLPFLHVFDVSTSDTVFNSGSFRVTFTPWPC